MVDDEVLGGLSGSEGRRKSELKSKKIKKEDKGRWMIHIDRLAAATERVAHRRVMGLGVAWLL